MILKRIKIELSHFFALSKEAQRLLISFFFMSASYPIIGTFINAYIFVNKGNIFIFIIYNLARFSAISLAFFLNGFLLRKFKIRYLYFFSNVFMGLASLMVVFYTGESLYNYFFYGLTFGLGEGFHWGNRNYLTLKETHSKNRTYFTALSFTAGTLADITISFFTGWLLVFGLSYKVLMGIGFLFLFTAGTVVLKSNYFTPPVNRIEVKTLTKKWWSIRWLEFAIGIGEAPIFFFPSFLILKYLGHEGVLGTLTAVASMVSAAAMYIYGRKSKTSHQWPVMVASLLVGLVITVFMALSFNSLMILVYVLLVGSVLNFTWLNAGPMIMDRIDEEIKSDEGERYAYIFDGEVFLNIGRTIGLILCLTLVLIFSQTAALRFLPLILYFLQGLFVFFLVRKLL